MSQLSNSVDNQTLCDLFGVANTGGIRVNKSRSLIVLVCNECDGTYRNEWRDGHLHFVGMGSVGFQKLDRQNKTLAQSARRGFTVHLFRVHERGKYTYVGEVELAGEPYMAEQVDASGQNRSVWVFPLRPKAQAGSEQSRAGSPAGDYLPHGVYAVIDAKLGDDQLRLVDDVLDKLKAAGVRVLDQRDIDERRYKRALVRWYEAWLDVARARVKEMIARRRRAAKAAGREFKIRDDELRIDSASTEADLRAALMLLDYDDRATMEEFFEDARRAVPMPEAPRSVTDVEEGEIQPPRKVKQADKDRFKDFT